MANLYHCGTVGGGQTPKLYSAIGLIGNSALTTETKIIGNVDCIVIGKLAIITYEAYCASVCTQSVTTLNDVHQGINRDLLTSLGLPKIKPLKGGTCRITSTKNDYLNGVGGTFEIYSDAIWRPSRAYTTDNANIGVGGWQSQAFNVGDSFCGTIYGIIED